MKKQKNLTFKEKNEKNNKFSNKGITMIALIITIIILLILAGVSIALLTGKNGIIKKAELAKNKTDQAQVEENANLQQYENIIEDTINNRKTVTISKEEYNRLKNVNTYTTDEVEIGTWINGKTIYRKIIEIPSGAPPSGSVNVVGDYSWVEHFLRADAICNSNNAMSSIFCISEGTTGLRLWCAEGFSSARYLIIEYTKKDEN